MQRIGTRQRKAVSSVFVIAAAVAAAVVLLAPASVGAALSVSATFSNPAAITINDGGVGGDLCGTTFAGKASPYPSQIAASALAGTVTDVNVTLTGLTHAFPDDVEVLLVGPGGQAALLMADAGGDPDLSGVNLTFDDAASSSLPEETQIVSGTYKPTAGIHGAGCSAPSFPSPAPGGPYGTALSVFNGSDPSGTWQLYVIDDTVQDAGSISGWSLDITVAPPDAAGQLGAVATELRAVVDAETGSSLADKAEDALAKVRSAMAKLERTPPDRQGVLGELEGAVGDLEAAVKEGGFAQGTDLMDRLSGAARLVAEEAIAEAKARGGAASKIAEAEQAVARGDAKRASARFKDAVARYKDAASKAEGA